MHLLEQYMIEERNTIMKENIRVAVIGPESRDPSAEMKLREVAEAVLFMLTRPRNVTIRDLVILPQSNDL